MRDVVVMTAVVVLSLWALRRPWVGILLWTWLSLMNPHRLGWGFAVDAPVAAIAAAVTFVGLLFTRHRQSPFQGAPVALFMCFAIWVTLSWFLGVDTDGDYPQWSKVMKIYLMTAMALVLIIDKKQIIAFAWVVAGSLAFFGTKGGIFTIINGGSYRVWGPPDSFIEDNNELALALIMTIPLLHFLQMQVQSRIGRHVVSAVMVLCAASALGSYSRGGLLAIAAMGAMIWWRSSHKAALSLLIGVFLVALVPMMPEDWWDRMRTIGEYDEDASAQGRLYAWGVAYQVAKNYFAGAGMSFQHPSLFALFGNGPDTVIAAHSIYFQVLGNHGFPGLFLFLLLWMTTYRTASWLRRNGGAHPESKWTVELGAMVQVSLIGYAVGGAFLSLAYFDLPYDLMVIVVLAKAWVKRRAWETESRQSFLEYVGVRRPRATRPPAASGGATQVGPP
ncbi:MAG: putative O-glycosylation ligase, exosortase A system-associated [Burkholderiales bacterium]